MSRNKFYRAWRWSDNQKVWWRFLWSAHRDTSVASVIEVHGGDYYTGKEENVREYNFRPFIRCEIPWCGTFMAALPRFLLRLFGGKKYGARYDLRTGFASVWYGRESWSSNEEQAWHCHVPWQSKRMVRYRFFAIDATTVIREFYNERGRVASTYSFEQSGELPKCSYKLTDYDGEAIYCTVHVKEMMWKHGEKWCRWLSWFVPNRVRKYVELEFCPGYGKKKHDWKGGTIGHSTDLVDGETVGMAVRRYCADHGLTFEAQMHFVYVPPPRPPCVPEPGACVEAKPVDHMMKAVTDYLAIPMTEGDAQRKADQAVRDIADDFYDPSKAADAASDKLDREIDAIVKNGKP